MTYRFAQNRLDGFVAMHEDDPYWEGLEDGVLQFPRCSGCGMWRWESMAGSLGQPLPRCGRCGTWEMEWTEVPMRGTVYSWATTNQVFYGLEARAASIPYTTLNVEIDVPEDWKPRVLGVLKGSAEHLRVGAPVTGSIDPPSEASNWYPGLRWTITR
ncbi:MAG: Zn-ribbon domain-containing OB-fold protein [Desertimonas sp.]